MYSTKQYVEVLMSIEVEGIKILMENIQCHLIQTIHTINRMFSVLNLQVVIKEHLNFPGQISEEV